MMISFKFAALVFMGTLLAAPAIAEQRKFKLINKSGYALLRL